MVQFRDVPFLGAGRVVGIPAPSRLRTLLRCLLHDREIPTRDSVIGSDHPDGRMDVHGAWRDRTAKRHCPGVPNSKGNAEAAKKGRRLQNGIDTAPRALDAMDALGERRHSRVAGASRAWGKTRAKSVDCARRRMEEKPGASGVGAKSIAAVQIVAAVHCSDKMGDSCSETRRQGSVVAESGTGRCTAERLS
jgi:hypothetical protein